MPRPGTIIPKAPLGKIMQKSGAQRVSDAALVELVEYLTEFSMKISSRALKIAKHSGRKTIHEGDVKLAVK